jgi:hypothetical protein
MLWHAAMADERAMTALRRIERAIARIEAAPAPQAPEPTDTSEVERLREAHRSLRTQVEGAIAQIDRLLEKEAG